MSSSHNETPKKGLGVELQSRKTPISTPKNFARFVLLSNNSNLLTPSPSLKHRVVRNPFENQLERLHLPVISSPSLFQSSTVTPSRRTFEWSIDELSNLNPVNVIPHETQYNENFDPIREAQAQAAINSFFTEQIIGESLLFGFTFNNVLSVVVPSPEDCSLRNQRIIFKDEDISLKIINSTAMLPFKADQAAEKRDAYTQTSLTFPPKLPKEVEEVLMKYNLMNDDDSGQGHEESDESFDASSRSMMDISTLRRKLFINPPHDSPVGESSPKIVYADLSPPPKSPQLGNAPNSCELKNATLRRSGSFGCDLFGELSPIRPGSPFNNSFNDVSMLSDFGGQETPSGRKSCLKLKKKGKNLSESFLLLQSEEFEENVEVLKIDPPKTRRFARYDSGFPADDEDSKFPACFETQNDYMQF